ncbi:armadillo-type protein [Amanita rubescens]|nr:armadillo-type protein [Amanita rubescens]
MQPSFAQGLHNLLVQSISNDTNLVKTATAQLNQEYYKNPACISALASIIANSPEQPVRQLAAVEMRKRVSQNSGKLWTLLPQNEREEIKAKLPEFVLAEPNDLVRHAAARVIASIASNEFSHATWPQLLPYLIQTCMSSDVKHREVGIYIIFTVLEAIAEGFEDHMEEFFKIFQQIRITTVRALGVLAQYIDVEDKKELRTFQALLPAIFQVIGQAVESGNENGARQLFDVLETLLILEIPILGKHIPELATFLLQCGGNRDFDQEMRILALNALNWAVQYKKSKIQHHNLAATILDGLMPITTEAEPLDVDDDAPSRSALRIIDGLSTSLPPSQVFPALRNLILQYYSSPDPVNRRGAMLALGVAVEGCSEFMTPMMNQVWPLIEAGLQDADAGVRKATCTAVGCLCEWLEDECVSKHAVLFPAIMTLINDDVTQRSACTALDAILEISGEVIDQYLQLIMERLAGLLETGANPRQDRFLPYFQPTMDRLQHFLVLTGEGEETELRGITMDAIGTFAEAVGKDVFRPYFPDMMKQAFQGIELGSARLRECSFLFFGVMARVFGEEFAGYLPSVVPPLLNSCKQSEHGDEAFSLSVSEAATAFSSGSSPDVDLDKMLDVNSAIAVEKEIAADTLGTLFAATQGHFLPYVELSTLELIRYWRSSGRSMISASIHPGSPGSVVQPLDPNVKELIGHSLVPLLDMYEAEDNKTVVAALLVGLAETINKIGPAFIENPGDLVASLANAMGAEFAPAFNTFCPLITKYYKKSRSLGDRSAAIGALAEIIAGMKSGITPHTEPLLELFFRALNDAEAEVQSNAAFAMGLLVECSEIDLTSHYLHILSALQRLFNVTPDSPAARLNAKDNAAGAVSRLIYKNGSAIPVDQVMPVFINALPLTNDFLENTPEKILYIFLHVLDRNNADQITDSIREELIQLIVALNAESPQAIKEVGLAAYLP